MAKPELGTKRHCPNCGTRYYDLNRDPILCPKCGTAFDVHSVARARPAAVVEEETEEEEETAGPEFVPLEEADEDAGDAETADIDGGGDEIDAADDSFLAEEDDEEGDVGDILPGVDDEEER